MENLDRKQIDAVRAPGGNELPVIRFARLPQVLPIMLSNTLDMFEHNVRSASILGIIGAGESASCSATGCAPTNWKRRA
ncbi:MAG: PhnE/PtxC family ABC transporter permease [Pseudomonadota bacterium]